MPTIASASCRARAFVGMNATVMDECVVESLGFVAAGALVTPGKRVKRGELWAGRPAKMIRELTEDDYKRMAGTGSSYAALAQQYRSEIG